MLWKKSDFLMKRGGSGKSDSFLFKDTKGAIMVEGVVVFPVFVIIFAATLYFFRLYDAHLQSNTKARHCAWMYADASCDSLPEECKSDDLKTKVASQKNADSRVGAFAKEKETLSSESYSTGGTFAGMTSTVNSLLQLKDPVRVQSFTRAQKPSLLGGKKISVAGRYSVMCNEKELKAKELAISAYCMVTRDKGPGC